MPKSAAVPRDFFLIFFQSQNLRRPNRAEVSLRIWLGCLHLTMANNTMKGLSRALWFLKKINDVQRFGINMFE